MFAACILSALFAAPAPPVGPPRQLLVVSNESGNYEVYLVHADRKEVKNLTNHRGSDSDAVWSGDGSRIAFVSDRDGTAHIYTMKPDGTDVKQVTRGVACHNPRFSPDGRRIAYVSNKDGVDQVFAIDADGKNVKQLTTGQFASRQPAWSPDGKKLSYSHYGPGLYDTQVINADGTNPVNLTNGQGGLDAAWSPDGKLIAFTSVRMVGAFRLYVMDEKGGDVKQLSDNNNSWGNVYPVWSPDSKRIAFTDWVGGSAQVAVVGVDGKDRTVLTREGTNWIARWSPDGKSISFLRSQDNKPTALWITSPDGKLQRELMKSVGGHNWRPATPPPGKKP